MAKNGFLTSGELMEAVRALDYKAQYKVFEEDARGQKLMVDARGQVSDMNDG